MAVLKSIASGDWTSASTWAVVNSTSYNNTETTTTLLTTSYQTSSTFTPGAITVDGIAVKLSARNGTTGTMTVALDQAGSDVAGTVVVINTADLPAAAKADLNGGWQYFKFASPVTLLAATAYGVKARTSSPSQISLFSTATTNWARALVTTTTAAPAAGDDLIIAGEYTGAGTSNSFTVTMNQTATTDYGAASTSLVLPALAICAKGTLTWATAAATGYNLKLSGNLIVYSGGEYNQGTVATPCPRDSTMKLQFDCVANVDFGMTVRNLGTAVMQGLSRSSGKDVYTCLLNTDEAAGQTVLGVDTDTGWLSGDEIGIASTSRTPSQTERRTLSANANAADMTVTAGLTNAHSGTSPTQGEIILITRNVSMFGVSTTVQTYLDLKSTATFDADWCEFYFMGSATTNKRGIDIATTTGSASFTYCSFRDWVVASSTIIVTGTATNNYTLQHCVWYNTQVAFANAVTSGTNWLIDHCYAVGCNGSGAIIWNFGDVGGVMTNITAAGNINVGVAFFFNQTNATVGTCANITIHSNGVGGNFNSFINSTVTNIVAWRNGGAITFVALGNVIIDGFTSFGNATASIALSSNSALLIKSLVSGSDSTFSTPSGVIFTSQTGGDTTFESSTFGVAAGIITAHTQDVLCSTQAAHIVKFNNCILASATEVASQSLLLPGASISSQKHDQTNGLNRKWKREGTITTDTTPGLFEGTVSARLTPLSATEKLDSLLFRSAVASGQTLSVTVKVRESVIGDGTAYNGNFPRLIVKRNVAAGIASDTVLATATSASMGAFEVLSGTTAAVTDDAILEFCVDCDGTTGWINVDTWTVGSQTSTLGLAYWKDGEGFAYGDNSAGGGGSATVGYAFLN